MIGGLKANGCAGGGGVEGAAPKTKGAPGAGASDANEAGGEAENEGAFGDLMDGTIGFAAPPTRPPLRSPDMRAPGGRYE